MHRLVRLMVKPPREAGIAQQLEKGLTIEHRWGGIGIGGTMFMLPSQLLIAIENISTYRVSPLLVQD